MSRWHWRVFCTVCGYNIRAAGNKQDLFHAMCGIGDCCPDCGTAVERRKLSPVHEKPFKNKLVRWVSTSVWWKFERQRKGYWKEKK